MELAFDLLLTLLIELPIIALFFKRKKRPVALMYGVLVNLISWLIAHILKISTDINIVVIEVVIITGEAVGLWLLTGCGWKKGFIMSVIANSLSFLATYYIHFDADIFQDKNNIITY